MENNKKMPISIVELASYEAPVAIEVKGKKWINYGENNDYFDYLLERFVGSPTNHAIITSTVQMIVGNGVSSTENDDTFQQLFSIDDITKWAFDLKWGGFYYMQVILSKDGKGIAKCKHTPVQNWRSGKADLNGVVHYYYYSDDWNRADQPNYRPKRYPAYNKDCKETVQILAVKPYRPDCFYYPYVDYTSGLKYAYLEEEISSFHLNNVFNGMFPGLLINFNNGDPGPDERRNMESLIGKKWGGSGNAGRWILSFNDDKDFAATIEAVQQPDLDRMFEYLSDEALQKIMLSHRVTSPMLFGIKDNQGLGNNAQETKTSFQLYENTVIQPYRTGLKGGFDYIGAQKGVDFGEIKYKSLNPFPFTYTPDGRQTPLNDTDEALPPTENLSSDKKKEIPEFTETEENDWIEHLNQVGEILDTDEWELVHEEPVNDPEAEFEFDDQDYYYEFANESKGELKTYSEPQKRSRQDDGLLKVRYSYARQQTQHNSRHFCVQMVGLAKDGVVYRKEDITKMGRDGVNGELAASGKSKYSIWLYKGGAYCHHYWSRRFYLRKRNKYGIPLKKSKTSELENDRKATKRELRATKTWSVKPVTTKDGTEIRVKRVTKYHYEQNDPNVAKRPNDMPNHGKMGSFRQRVGKAIKGILNFEEMSKYK